MHMLTVAEWMITRETSVNNNFNDACKTSIGNIRELLSALNRGGLINAL